MGNTIAIIGASTERSKYGNKAVRAFRDGGWIVYPVNPKESEIEGLPCYSSIAHVPEPLDRVSLYLPPRHVLKILDDIAAKNPKEVFFNPGTANDEVITAAKAKGIEPIQACSIVNIGLRPDQYPDY